MKTSPLAGTLPDEKDLINVPELIKAFYKNLPDPAVASQRVLFGTSGHRGCSLENSFNSDHILAITQAICFYRAKSNINGPLLLGFDTHAVSLPAFEVALEVLAANDVTVWIAQNQEFTPTPVISHGILCYNKDREGGFADGIVITPSHNPPREGGFKYNPPHGGPAEQEITDWIQNKANEILKNKLSEVKKIPFEKAIKTSTIHSVDFMTPYVNDLINVLDFEVISQSGLKVAVDPLGGAGVHYWASIAEKYKINLTVLNKNVDPTFRFMTRDWDGQIRMDPSSPYAMKSVIKEAPNFDISFACDTDHDRHGVVTKADGLMAPNPYLCTSIFYLFKNRPQWSPQLKIGKTLVSSQMIDRVSGILQRPVYEVPVGFKWFVQGLLHQQLAFAGEESAGATFLRKNGKVWTTDKDGIIPSLLSAEMTARLGKDPAQIYRDLSQTLGDPLYARIEAPASLSQREKIKKLQPSQISQKELAGDKIQRILNKAPGNDAAIGGIKVETKNGWIAMRPSGTEDIYKIYGESFVNQAHLDQLLEGGQKIINDVFDSTSGKECLTKAP